MVQSSPTSKIDWCLGLIIKNYYYYYCRGDRPSSMYLYILGRGHEVVRGQVNIIMGVRVSE